MEVLESRRSLLEDLEIIENAIAARLDRNPELYYSYVQKRAAILNDDEIIPPSSKVNSNRIYKRRKTKRNRKQIMTQQHEINLFLRESFRKLKELASLNGPVETESLKDENNDFESFTNCLHEIDEKFADEGNTTIFELNEKISDYSIFSASNPDSPPTTVLSKKANGLQLNDIFKRVEQYGECLDLESFHSEWFKVIKSTDCTLLQFFNNLSSYLDNEKYLLEPPMDRKNERYFMFLEKLGNYLESFFQKSYALIDHKLLDKILRADFQLYLETPVEQVSKGYYSVASCRWFKTQAVFSSYLTGKTHKKNVAKRYTGLLSEYKIHRYLNLLQNEFKNTREFVERKLAFTAEERIDEMARLNEVYESADYSPDEVEDDNDGRSDQDKTTGKKDAEGSLDLPLGPDGLPIPYWLYKLQGLDVTYTCEICGNLEFKGRRAFEKHFSEPTHLFRLRCLGIEPSSVFKGIASVKEALDLWHRVGVKKGIKAGGDLQVEVAMEVEAEDEEGNVMSEKLYEELKKQGLV